MREQVYIGRQLIIDRQQKIIGYELLYRDSAAATSAQISDEAEAGAKVLVNTLSHMGTEWLFGDNLAFINISSSMLASEFLDLLPAHRVVLDLLDTGPVTPQLLERCDNLRIKGFRLALNNIEPSPETEPLLAVADYVKLDIQLLGQEVTAKTVRALKSYSAHLIAEKVETKSEFRFCKELGFAYYQGFHFAHPETLTARVIHPAQAHVVELLNKVRNNADVHDIEVAFKQDVALSFKLLRYINSVGFGFSQHVHSIRHALTILGYRQLYRWLTLLLVTAGEGSVPGALVKTAIARGRLTELLGQDRLQGYERDNLFIVGIFSVLDAILEMPMDRVVETLGLPEQIGNALLDRSGIYGGFLALAEACEGNDLGRIEQLAGALDLSGEKVNQAHLGALAWVEALAA